MSFSKKENKFLPFVVFDIGSASVGGALVVAEEEAFGGIKIVYNTREHIAFQNSLEPEYLLSTMLGVLKKVGENIEKNGMQKLFNEKSGKRNIENIFCVLSSSWYISDTEIIKSEKENPFIVSEKFIEDLLKDADKHFKKSSKLQFEMLEAGNFKLIEKNIIQILLNGYNTNNPQGKKVNRADATLFVSMMSSEVYKKITSVLEKIFGARNTMFHTFELALFSAVRDIFKTEIDFLIMDISGEVTDITLVRNETIVKTVSFSLGRNFLIRKVANSLNAVPEEAHSLIRLFLDEKSSSSERAKMERILVGAKEEWLLYFRKILSDFSDGLSLPRTIFLTIDTDIGKWFIDTIKQDEFSSYTLAREPFTVVELSSRILNKHCAISKDSKTGCDPFLAIEAIFVHKIGNK